MHQELHQFVRNDVWELVPRPKDAHLDRKSVVQGKSVGEDGEGLKKNDGDGNMSPSDDGERQSPEKESTPTASRRETRPTQGH